jgi:hypothetical protein
VSGDFGARIWNPDLIQEGHWHHLALVWSRAVLKNSQFSLYIDGQLVYTGKVSRPLFLLFPLNFYKLTNFTFKMRRCITYHKIRAEERPT